MFIQLLDKHFIVAFLILCVGVAGMHNPLASGVFALFMLVSYVVCNVAHPMKAIR
jgi:hypothetical protein